MSRFFAVGLLVCWLNLTAMGIPPTITNNRTTYEIPDGGTVNISCKVTGHPKPSIIWEIDGTNVNKLANSEPFNFTVSENDTLDIRNPRRNKAYGLFNVTCIAENTNGTAQKTFNVTIFKAPWITNNKDIYDVPEGGSRKINLNCDTGGFPSPLVNWSIKGNILSEARSYFDNNSKPFNVTVWKNRTLQILPWRKNDGFGVNVTCIADNNIHKQSSKVFLVRFLRVPRILTPREIISIFRYEYLTVNFDCVTTGYPKPKIEWKFGGYVLNAIYNIFIAPYVVHVIDNKNVLVQSSYTLLGNGRLRITNPLVKENVPHENFTCVARNIAGEDSRSFELYIGEKISHTFEILLSEEEFTENKENILKKIRDSLLVVKADLVNITSVNFNLRTVNFEMLWKKEDSTRGLETLKVEEIAVIVEEALKNGGIGLLNLLMNEPPPPPRRLTASDISSNSITITWKRPKYFEIDFYQVQLTNSSESPTWQIFTKVDGSREETTLEGLESDKEYSIKLKSANRHGIGERKSNILNVRTKAKVIPSPRNDVPAGNDNIVVVVVVVVVIVLVILAIMIVYHWRQKQQLSAKENNPYEESIPGIPFRAVYVRENKTFCPTGNTDGPEEQEEYFSWNEISRDDLALGDILGEGEFGKVVKAVWSDEQSNADVVVAVKTVKDIATDDERTELFKELKLMADVTQHPNVVNLLGACSKGGPLLVIVEFCEHGNLLSYIRKNRKDLIGGDRPFTSSLDPLTRARFACDVSKGMSHLEKMKIVHRDLATRNVLLGRNRIAKVSDFGLSRDIYELGIYQKKTGGKLPVKWMAIESLEEAKYTSKSDVWSFGVLFWEIETAGVIPYPGIAGLDLLKHLQRGYRLPKPAETLLELYEIMKTCWESNPEVRPSFKELHIYLESFMKQNADYLQDDLPEVENKDNTDDDEAYVIDYLEIAESE